MVIIQLYISFKVNKNSLKHKSVNKSIRKPLPRGIRHEVFVRDNYTCQECGAEKGDVLPNGDKVKLHIDHIIPVSCGGTDELSNLQTLCQECNLNKSNLIQEPQKINNNGGEKFGV